MRYANKLFNCSGHKLFSLAHAGIYSDIDNLIVALESPEQDSEAIGHFTIEAGKKISEFLLGS